MSSKSVRNLIIALVILAIGIKTIMIIFNNYLTQFNIPVSGLGSIVEAVEQYGTLTIYGIIVIIVILIPVYLSKRSDEKKSKNSAKPIVQKK